MLCVHIILGVVVSTGCLSIMYERCSIGESPVIAAIQVNNSDHGPNPLFPNFPPQQFVYCGGVGGSCAEIERVCGCFKIVGAVAKNT